MNPVDFVAGIVEAITAELAKKTAGNSVLAWEIAVFVRRTLLVPEAHWKAAAAGPHY